MLDFWSDINITLRNSLVDIAAKSKHIFAVTAKIWLSNRIQDIVQLNSKLYWLGLSSNPHLRGNTVDEDGSEYGIYGIFQNDDQRSFLASQNSKN